MRRWWGRSRRHHPPALRGAILDVRAGHSYRVDVAYGANVPFGIDPHAHYNISIGVTPEPMGLGIMFSALLVMRRRCSMRDPLNSQPATA
jgi:hypothetical protein